MLSVLPFSTSLCKTAKLSRAEPRRDSQGKKTQDSNLICYKPSGIYYAQLVEGGKLLWKRLKTYKVRLPSYA